MIGILAAATVAAATSSQAFDQAEDLNRLSIEELADVEVTTVSKRPERLGDAAASIFVIDREDIRATGVRSLPEALRLAPNLNVQRVDALDYAISARGLNGFESSNKVLLMIDGRSVYSPFFSGVEWSQHHPMLGDVERIEVVSGPGGALWGSNAVNGVISVVSRSAADTKGFFADAVVGSSIQMGSLRYGADLGPQGAYRIYFTSYRRGQTELNGAGAGDDWTGRQGGFRSDFAWNSDTLTVQGDLYHDDVDSQVPANPDGKLEGGNLLARWSRGFSDGSRLEVQSYYDRYERRARGILDGVITLDAQAQYAFERGRHRLVAGVGRRTWSDRFNNYVNGFVLSPPSRRTSLSNAFLQDQISLGAVTVTVGIKAENSSYSGLEWMPSIRAGWKISDRTLLWGAVSRAVRNPSRLDRELIFPPLLVASDFTPEKLVAYELGYRGRPAANVSLSATLFLHDYDDIRSTEPTPVTVFPVRIGNGLEGQTWGLEAWGDWDVSPRWRLSAGLSTLGKDIHRGKDSGDLSNLAAAGHDPAGQGFVESRSRFGERLDLTLRVRYVAETPRERTGGYLDAPAYADADVRLGWRATDNVELALVGRNLLDASHPEATEPRRTEVRRSLAVSLRATW